MHIKSLLLSAVTDYYINLFVLIRIWDKVIGGAHGIVVYVAVAIFLTFKRPLLSMKKRDEMLQYMMEVCIFTLIDMLALVHIMLNF